MSSLATSAAWVRGIVELLAGEGVDGKDVLAAAGIDPASLDAPGARLATDSISAVWEIAVERSGNPFIGLAQPHVVRPAVFDVVGYAMMSCANLRDAFERLVRYLRILSDALTLTRCEDGRGRYSLSFELHGGERPVPRARMEFILVTVNTFCRWVSGRDLNPLEVAFAYPPPADSALYRQAFRCPVSFDARVCSLTFAADDLEKPLSTSNPGLATQHERYAGEYLERFDNGQTSYRVREAIVRRLPDGEPRRDQVARELCMSERTLQRRLEDESASFGQLLNDTRRGLAVQYLNRLHLSLAETAYLLGFSEQSSFFRACKRWFGLPPGEYRRQLSLRAT
jgi:AraC-like DNA-binding protein